ncbi:MAG: hypothetical protein LQ340_000279 [Diploschistes diacapsis]|nr:MAG: hypothetical protein LQ340_000279 [Diploschistes diacapsis]
MSYYYAFAGDFHYIQGHWTNFTISLNFSLNNIDSPKPMNVTSPDDWSRFDIGAQNMEANTILLPYNLAGHHAHKFRQEGYQLGKRMSRKGRRRQSSHNRTPLERNRRLLSRQPNHDHRAVGRQLVGHESQHHPAHLPDHRHFRPLTLMLGLFISGFNLDLHFLASDPDTALDLVRMMWADFMFGGRRVSHAHEWATGPTPVLTFYVADLQLESAVGKM